MVVMSTGCGGKMAWYGGGGKNSFTTGCGDCGENSEWYQKDKVTGS